MNTPPDVGSILFDDEMSPERAHELFAQIIVQYMNSLEFLTSNSRLDKGRLLQNVLILLETEKRKEGPRG